LGYLFRGLRNGRNGRTSRIAVDDNANVYVAGITESTDCNLLNATQVSNQGVREFYLAKLGANGQLQWGSYLGGVGYEALVNIVVDSNGSIYVSGTTSSANISGIANHGYYDFVLAKFNSAFQLQWLKLDGGTNYDYASSLAISADGYLIVAGQSQSSGLATIKFVNPSMGQPNGIPKGYIANMTSTVLWFGARLWNNW